MIAPPRHLRTEMHRGKRRSGGAPSAREVNLLMPPCLLRASNRVYCFHTNLTVGAGLVNGRCKAMLTLRRMRKAMLALSYNYFLCFYLAGTIPRVNHI